MKIETFEKVKELISFFSLVAYIVFSVILIFVENNNYFLIPTILYGANIFMIIEVAIVLFKKYEFKTKKQINWLIFQVVTNILGFALSIYAFKF
ncbi:MAG: hypothetical protein QMB99_03540 [Paludibacteraceae bacterium]|jgi:hypothetical protein